MLILDIQRLFDIFSKFKLVLTKRGLTSFGFGIIKRAISPNEKLPFLFWINLLEKIGS